MSLLNRLRLYRIRTVLNIPKKFWMKSKIIARANNATPTAVF